MFSEEEGEPITGVDEVQSHAVDCLAPSPKRAATIVSVPFDESFNGAFLLLALPRDLQVLAIALPDAIDGRSSGSNLTCAERARHRRVARHFRDLLEEDVHLAWIHHLRAKGSKFSAGRCFDLVSQHLLFKSPSNNSNTYIY